VETNVSTLFQLYVLHVIFNCTDGLSVGIHNAHLLYLFIIKQCQTRLNNMFSSLYDYFAILSLFLNWLFLYSLKYNRCCKCGILIHTCECHCYFSLKIFAYFTRNIVPKVFYTCFILFILESFYDPRFCSSNYTSFINQLTLVACNNDYMFVNILSVHCLHIK